MSGSRQANSVQISISIASKLDDSQLFTNHLSMPELMICRLRRHLNDVQFKVLKDILQCADHPHSLQAKCSAFRINCRG
eukprot:scaffold78404_cov37-Prasinocladus_malaysianus.AAC.1